MKHVFKFHSPITYLVSLLIVQEENLPIEDVIFVSKSFKPEEIPYQNHLSFESNKRGVIKKLINLNEPAAFDEYLSSLVDEDEYIAYVPLMDVYERLLITHTKCVGFNFIEEGMMSYRISTKLNHLYRSYKFSLRNSIRKNWKEFRISLTYILRGWTLRILELPFPYEAYSHIDDVKFYGISSESFPLAPKDRKKILSINAARNIEVLAKNTRLGKNTIIWLEESYAKNNNIPNEVYENAVDKALTQIQQKYPNHKIYLKLRPNNKLNESTVARVFNSRTINFELLDSTLIVEALMVINEPLVWVGNVSSALFYASKMNHEAWSIYDCFMEHSNRTFNEFPVYWENVKKL